MAWIFVTGGANCVASDGVRHKASVTVIWISRSLACKIEQMAATATLDWRIIHRQKALVTVNNDYNLLRITVI
jgi:hypothetical protein